ncbi:MAG: trypsin-like peptidase domain-containing protein [Thermoanaerobaculia bacterium]
MSSERKRQFVSIALLAAAVAFGVVLAGGLDLTPAATSDPQVVEPQAVGGGGLPGFADLAETVSPAVVFIESVRIEEVRTPRGFPADPFEWFFGPRRDQDDSDEPRERRQEGGGSGFVVDASGLVITNNHVVEQATDLRVHLGDDTYTAEVVGTDPFTDLALLRIQADRRLPYLKLGDSDAVRPGDWVMAIGSPMGEVLENTVTVGVVSAKGRQIGIMADASFENFLQTDAAINFGNSGGPLLNLRGEVIGINTAINWGSENIGFAVPVNTLKSILPQLREKGRVDRGYLGITINNLTPEAAEAFGLQSGDGILVNDVRAGEPAAQAGLQHGDIIKKVDGREVSNTRDFIDYVSGLGPGAKVRLELLREGERLERTVELAERPDIDELTGRQQPERQDGGGGSEWLGLRYQDLTPSLKRLHGLPGDVEGVLITRVAADSPLYDEGLGDERVQKVITEVNGEAVAGAEEFEAAIADIPSGNRVRLYVRLFVQGEELQQSPIFVFPRVP